MRSIVAISAEGWQKLKCLPFLLCIFALAGCNKIPIVIPANYYAPMPEVLAQLPDSSYLQGRIELGAVQVSPVGSESNYIKQRLDVYTATGFKSGLQFALSQAKLLGNKKPQYVLDATLKELKLLDRGWNYNNLSGTVEYTLRQKSNNKIVYQETLTVSYVDNASLGEERAAISHMGLTVYTPNSHIDKSELALISGYPSGMTMRENVTQLIRVLSAKQQSDLSQ